MSSASITLRQLRAFLAVAEELSFTRAAERLLVSTPWLSETVKELEHQLKVTLFVRTTRSVELTEAGRVFSGLLAHVLDDLDDAVRVAQRMAARSGPRHSDPDVFLLAGRYTLLEQEPLGSFLPLCLERGIAVVVGGAYNSGLLADPNPGTHYNYLPAPPELISRAQRLQAVCQRHGVPLKAAAIQFPAAHPAVAAVLTGARRPEELQENCAMFDRPIPGDLWRELRSEGLLDERAPVPPEHEEATDV